jgi:hypothetical protein
MSHSKDDEDKEDIDCLLDHVKILQDTLMGLKGTIKKEKVIQELKQIKKRVDYMIDDLEGKNG